MQKKKKLLLSIPLKKCPVYGIIGIFELVAKLQIQRVKV